MTRIYLKVGLRSGAVLTSNAGDITDEELESAKELLSRLESLDDMHLETKEGDVWVNPKYIEYVMIGRE